MLARIPEGWVLDTVQEIIDSEDIIKRVVERESAERERASEPNKEALALTREALLDNQHQIDTLIETISSGQATGALFELLNEKAEQLKLEGNRLRVEERRLAETVKPLHEYFDAIEFRLTLANFQELAQVAEGEELQRLLRLMVRKMEWRVDGEHRVQFHLAPLGSHRNRFVTKVQSGGPERSTYEPLIFRLYFLPHLIPVLETAAVRAVS